MQKNTIIRFSACCLILLFIILAVGYKLYTIFSLDVPLEFREMNMIAFADAFARGKNQYSRDILNSTMPEVTNVYGFIMPLLLTPFVRIGKAAGISALQTCEAVCIGIECLCLFLTYRIIYLRNKDRLSAIGGAAVMFSCMWRYTACGGAFPDPLGIAAEFFLVYIIATAEKYRNYDPALYACILVGMFYIKQYYFFPVLGMGIYLLIRSHKLFLRFAVSGILIGVLSLLVVNAAFPLYFTEAFPVSQGSTFSSDLYYSLSQIPEQIIRSYKLPIMFLIASPVLFFICRKTDAKTKLLTDPTLLRYEVIQCFVILLPCAMIAKNLGTRYTYYLQLWWPYVIIVSFSLLPGLLKRFGSLFPLKESYLTLAAVLLVFLSIADCSSMIISEPLTPDQKQSWDQAYTLLDQYSENGEMLVSSHLSNYCLEHNIPTPDYGQAEYNSEQALLRYLASPIWPRLFPDAETIFRQNIDYKQQIMDNINSRHYSGIALTDTGGYLLDPEDILDAGYHEEARLELVTGQEKWETVFFSREQGFH